MRRLLQLNVTANWGSTGKIAEGIGLAAIRRGWESTVAFGRYVNPSASKLIKVGEQRDVYLHYARSRFLDGEGLGSRSATKRLVDQIKELAPDIIQLHNIHDHWLNYPLLFEYLATTDTPVVWTFHDCWAFTGGCSHFENAGCFKWREECDKCCQQRRWSADRSRRNFTLKKELLGALQGRLTVVGVSEWLRNYVAQSFLGDCRLEVINNGVNTQVFSQAQVNGAKPMVLGVSNVWPPSKGLADFVELRKLLSPDIEIVLVGLTEKQIRDLPEGIKGVQRTSSVEELVNLYREAAMFVNPTHNDSFPTVNLEALACGTPVVTYRTGGSPEAVDENTGIVVDKGDVRALASAIKKVIGNPSAFSSENCRRRAEACFNRDVQFGKYIDLYESILSEK